jgi:hypothetical protein
MTTLHESSMTKRVSFDLVTHYPLWQQSIAAALNEPDLNKLLERVHAAEMAIFNRVQELARNPDGMSYEAERQAISDACKTLAILKQEKLGFPDWENK